MRSVYWDLHQKLRPLKSTEKFKPQDIIDYSLQSIESSIVLILQGNKFVDGWGLVGRDG